MAGIDVVSELARLVAYPTVSNGPVTALAAHLASRAEDAGFRVDTFATGPGKASVVASIGPRDDPGGLVISGHMDVVPTEDQPWTTDPFVLSERDGRLYGRGTADMKGFIAAVVAGLATLPLQPLRRRLMLVWTHDEEIGCLGSAALAQQLAGEALPSACWIGEPTEFAIQRMHPGHVVAEVEVRGRAAHSSRPDLGLNAIEGMAAILNEARALAAELAASPETDLPEIERPWVVLNLAQVHGGQAVNIVPDRCVLTLGYRPLPGHEPTAVADVLRARILELGLPHPVAVRVDRVTPSMLTPLGTPLERALRPFADHPGCSACTFATDGGNLARLGLAPLVFGPGSIQVAHQADEYVTSADLVRAVSVVHDVVRKWCA